MLDYLILLIYVAFLYQINAHAENDKNLSQESNEMYAYRVEEISPAKQKNINNKMISEDKQEDSYNSRTLKFFPIVVVRNSEDTTAAPNNTMDALTRLANLKRNAIFGYLRIFGINRT
nr:uncharacterized protein LOC122271262 [Parasteatoda tepidariorum]